MTDRTSRFAAQGEPKKQSKFVGGNLLNLLRILSIFCFYSEFWSSVWYLTVFPKRLYNYILGCMKWLCSVSCLSKLVNIFFSVLLVFWFCLAIQNALPVNFSPCIRNTTWTFKNTCIYLTSHKLVCQVYRVCPSFTVSRTCIVFYPTIKASEKIPQQIYYWTNNFGKTS